jgi:Ca2+/Na+ antiporter
MKIQYIVLAAIIFFLIRFALDDKIGIVSNLIQSIICAILFVWIYTKRTREKIDLLDNYLGKKVINCGIMTHKRGIIGDVGVAYLLSDCLAFVPHRLNFSQKPFTIMLSDVECVSGYRILGMFDYRLKITLESGKIERFNIYEQDVLYKKLLEVCGH